MLGLFPEIGPDKALFFVCYFYQDVAFPEKVPQKVIVFDLEIAVSNWTCTTKIVFHGNITVFLAGTVPQ